MQNIINNSNKNNEKQAIKYTFKTYNNKIKRQIKIYSNKASF